MIQREFKDRLFRFIFNDLEALLSLYNALHDTHYTDPEDIDVTTLDDVIYMNLKNDISFILDYNLSLFEHQSSLNPNMPLRGLLYFARQFEKILKGNWKKIYGSRLMKLPTPKYVVFYNGDDMREERMTLRLSDAFYHDAGEPCMELEALVLNINYGHNKELMEKCQPLWDYSRFIHRVKGNAQTMELEDSIDAAVDQCIKENILKDILESHRAEVKNMILTEYDQEEMIKYLREEAAEDREAALLEYKHKTEEAISEMNAALERENTALHEKDVALQQAKKLQKQLNELRAKLQET